MSEMGILYKLFKGLIDNGSGDTEKKERWNCEQDLAFNLYLFFLQSDRALPVWPASFEGGFG